MNENRYVLDANVVSRLTAEQRASPFVSAHCRIPSDVMYEIQGIPDGSSISHLELPVDARILARLRDVMATVAPTDLSLVNLYRNKGAADPVVIAAALAADQGEGQLWSIHWHVVSDDHAVRNTAATLGVPWLSRAHLVELIDR